MNGGKSPKNRFHDLSCVKILKRAELEDPAFALLRPKADLAMLLAFLQRFDRLGWFPPLDGEKRALLAANDVIIHRVSPDVCFYEFCSKGARGERDPWLTLLFHVDTQACVRICGVVPASFARDHRPAVVKKVGERVRELEKWLRRRRKEK